MNNCKIYVISVKENIERRQHVDNLTIKLNNLGFIVEIIDAIYWKTTNVMQLLQQLNINVTNLAQSQIACFLSHRLVWQKIETNTKTNDINIILEDDMDLTNIELFNNIKNNLVNISYDGVIMWKHPDKLPTKFSPYNKYLVNYYSQWGLCAYTVNSNLCNKMLEINNINMPIDDYLYNYIFPNYKVYLTHIDPFTNLGFLGGTHTEGHQFKSLIYG